MRLCSVEGCGKRHVARGWCRTHYSQWKRSDASKDLPDRYRHGPICSVEDCDQPHRGKGFCRLHYERFLKHGSPHLKGKGGASMRENRMTGQPCSIAGCAKPVIGRGWCGMHYARWRTYGDPEAPDRRAAGQRLRATLDWRNPKDLAQLDWTPIGSGYRGAGWPEHPNASRNGRVSQHTAVMAAVLGRPVAEGETVHHKNGVRSDNRPENLELWVTAHPAGQRVSELIAFATEILDRYRDDMQLWPEHLRA